MSEYNEKMTHKWEGDCPEELRQAEDRSELNPLSGSARLRNVSIERFDSQRQLVMEWDNGRGHSHRIPLGCGKAELIETLMRIARYIEDDSNI